MKRGICVILLMLCLILSSVACSKQDDKQESKKTDSEWSVNETDYSENNNQQVSEDSYMDGGGTISAYKEEKSDISDKKKYIQMIEYEKNELSGIEEIQLEYSVGYSKENEDDYLEKNTLAYIGVFVNDEPVNMKIDGELYEGMKLVECEPFKNYSAKCEIDFSKYSSGVVSIAIIPLVKEGDVFEDLRYMCETHSIGVSVSEKERKVFDKTKGYIYTDEEVTNMFGKELGVSPVHLEKALDGNYYCVISTGCFSTIEDMGMTKLYGYVLKNGDYISCFNSNKVFECDMEDYDIDTDRCNIVKKLDISDVDNGEEMRLFVTSYTKGDTMYDFKNGVVSLSKVYE